jgi:hypothetical protein
VIGFDVGNARVIDVNKGEIGCSIGWKTESLADAPVVGNPFEPFKEIEIEGAQETEEQDDPDGDQSGSQLDGL